MTLPPSRNPDPPKMVWGPARIETSTEPKRPAGVSAVCSVGGVWSCGVPGGFQLIVTWYRLPTETEWEHADRGGEHNPYYRYPWGDTIDGSQANYWASGDPYEPLPDPDTTPVGYYDGNQFPAGVDMANGWWLYDIAGNVYDWYTLAYYEGSPYGNPRGPASGVFRVLRGGSSGGNDYGLRCARRNWNYPINRGAGTGIRLVLVPVCGDDICGGYEAPCNCPQDCGPCPVPTTSAWSIAVASLLLLTLGTLAIRRRAAA